MTCLCFQLDVAISLAPSLCWQLKATHMRCCAGPTSTSAAATTTTTTSSKTIDQARSEAAQKSHKIKHDMRATSGHTRTLHKTNVQTEPAQLLQRSMRISIGTSSYNSANRAIMRLHRQKHASRNYRHCQTRMTVFIYRGLKNLIFKRLSRR